MLRRLTAFLSVFLVLGAPAALARPLLLTLEHVPHVAVVDNFACAAFGADVIRCTFDTDVPTTSQIQYQVAPIGWSTSAADATADHTSHTVDTVTLAAGTTLYLRAKVATVEGVETYSAYVVASVPAGGSVPVLTSFSPTQIGTTSAQFGWDTDLDSDSQLQCGTTSGVYTVTSTLDATTTSMHLHTITGLTSGVPWYCQGLSDAGSGAGESAEYLIVTASAGTLSPPNIGALDIAQVDPSRVCRDAEGDGVCEDFLWKVTQPFDSTGWPVVNLGTNPTAGAVSSAINAATGCTVFEYVGRITMPNNTSIKLTEDCFVFRGSDPATRAQIELPAGVSPNTSGACTGGGSTEVGAVTACGTQGSQVGWIAHYNRGDTVITVDDASPFVQWSAAAPWTSGMFVGVSANFGEGNCPERYQQQLGQPRDGNYAIHYVIGKSGSDLTIYPPLRFDYDEYDPSCASYRAFPLALPLVGFENLEIYSADGDHSDSGRASCMPAPTTCDPAAPFTDNPCDCTLNNEPFLTLNLVQGYVRNVYFHDHINVMVRLRKTGPLALWSNRLTNPPASDPNFTNVQFNSQMIHLSEGASGFSVLDNQARDLMVFMKHESGASGVIAHNYCTATNLSDRAEKCWFVHGTFGAKETLLEGNDMRTMTLDQWWGQSGDFIVLYRNSVHDSTFNASIEGLSIETRGGPLAGVIVARYLTLIGNYTDYQIDSGGTAPFQFFADAHTPFGHGEFNWSSNTAVFGGCATCSLSNNVRSATPPAYTASVASGGPAVPPSLFCFADPSDPTLCEDREWPPYWLTGGAVFRDPHDSIGAFSATQKAIPAKARELGTPGTLCDLVAGVGC